MEEDKCAWVMAHYAWIDGQTAAVQKATGLHCPPGCGRCCQSRQVEATVLEMLPLAQELWARGEAALWYERAQLDPTRCVFYTPDQLCFGTGRCQAYPWRPLLCRLFGYAAVRDKHGHAMLGVCRFLKDLAPELAQRAHDQVKDGLEVVTFAAASAALLAYEPSLTTPAYPINEALWRALERVSLHHQLQSGAGPDADTPPEVAA